MGKKAIKRTVVIWFAGLATFSVLANDLLPVSAPILAVEIDGNEAIPNDQHSVAPNPVPRIIQTGVVHTMNPPEVSPGAPSSQIPVLAETREQVVAEPEPEINSEIVKARYEPKKQIPATTVLFTSDWFELSPRTMEIRSLSNGEARTYLPGRSAPEVGAISARDAEPAKHAFRSPAPLLPTLNASRPSLFGRIVNRKVRSLPTHPAVLSFTQFVSRGSADVSMPLTSATHESNSEPVFAVNGSVSDVIIEGPKNEIGVSVISKALSVPVPFSVVSNPSPVKHGTMSLSTFAAKMFPASPLSVEGPRNEIGLSVFPRAISVPVPFSVVSNLSWVKDGSVSQHIFATKLSTALPLSVEGPRNEIGLSVTSRELSVPVPFSVVSNLSPVKDGSVSQVIFVAKPSPTSSAVLEVSSDIGLAVFPRRPMPLPPALPVVVPSTGSKDIPAAALATAISPVPLLISGHTAFSKAMLEPLGSAAQRSSEPVADLFVASNRGPSADLFAHGLATRRAGLENAKLPTVLSPVLVTGQPRFSDEMLKPLNLKPVQARPFNASAPIPAVPISGKSKQVDGYCDPKFVGEPIRFSQTVELRLEDLLNQLNARFGINFIVGQNVGKIPLNVKAGSIPWNILLRSQLFVSGVRARCINPNTIELVLNRDLPTLQDEGDVTTKFVKLKFFQRTSGGTVDLANRSQGGQNGGQGGCGGSGGGQSGGLQSGGLTGGGSSGGQMGQTAGQLGNNRFDKLIFEIEKVLGIRSMVEGGSSGRASNSETEEIRTNRFVTQIPGRNILVIRASDEEHELVDQIIERADRPPFQVVIKALVYSANQDRLRDIGGQVSILGGTGNSDTLGGIFGHTVGAGTLFDFSTILGTFDFNVQFKALQQNGVISVKSRPFSTVIDGLCTTLNVGRELPIVIDSTLGGQGDVVFVNAANRLAVTPYVIDDENGNPIAVTLELSLDANDIDSSVTTRGVPAISRRSIQTQLLLGEDKTAILGGFTVDQDSKAISKTPGLGNIPIIGELFKRRIRDTRLSRLYFAISASIVPYGEAIAPIVVPGVTTDPKTLTEEMKNRAEEADKEFGPTKKKKKDN